MSFRKRILYLLFVMLLVWGCTEEISLDLDSSEKKVVIEGYVSTIFDYQDVRITESQDYFNYSPGQPVTGARVSVNDTGNVFGYVEIRPGLYRSRDEFAAIEGMTYNLEVQLNGKSYTATSITPVKPVIDSIVFYADYSEPDLFQIGMYGQENPEPGDNYFWGVFQYQINLTPNISMLNFASDRFFNGSDFNGASVQIVTAKYGSRITLQMVSIPAGYFAYARAILSETVYNDGPFEPAPANIKGNITGALGFFYARSETFKTGILNPIGN